MQLLLEFHHPYIANEHYFCWLDISCQSHLQQHAAERKYSMVLFTIQGDVACVVLPTCHARHLVILKGCITSVKLLVVGITFVAHHVALQP